jgi:hypothetical protein
MSGGSYPGPWTFKYFPWLKDMHDCDAELLIGQKAAQMGFSEAALNRVFFKIDIKKSSAMYILPSKTPDASDFSASRFDSALESSPHLRQLFSDVKNVGHKRAGSVNLFIRGSHSRAGLKSNPTGHLVFDEVDEMDQINIPLALERQSGQLEKQSWFISTPTIDSYGINSYFERSTQQEFFFKCPSCGRQTNLTFPECIEIPTDDVRDQKLKDSYYKCRECKNKLVHEDKSIWLADGVWIPKFSNRDSIGFHINQMYSTTIPPWKLAESYLLSLSNAAYEQEFYNSKLGLPRIIKGARVTDDDITASLRNYANGSQPKESGSFVCIGIDVGNWCHYIVTEYTLPPICVTPDINMNARARILEINKVLSYNDLEAVIYKYRPRAVVIDAQPDRRKSYELAQKFWGSVWLCFFSSGINGKQISKTKDDAGQSLEQCVTVDRTSWLDLSLGRFINHSVELPIDTPLEFKDHLKALVRKPELDKSGNPTSKYVSLGNDHYGLANCYAEVALSLASNFGVTQSIRSPR